MENKRLDAARHLLDRGVRFRLPAPFWLRWLNPSITLRSHKAGTILYFSEVVLKHNLEEVVLAGNNEQLSKSIKPIVECLAISVLNDYLKIKLFKKILSKYLLWQVDKQALVEMFLIAFEVNNSKDFTTITKWYVQQMKMMMNPNLGQMEKGS